MQRHPLGSDGTHCLAPGWACRLQVRDLTPDAIDAAKRHGDAAAFLYDTIGCALGGYQVPRRQDLPRPLPRAWRPGRLHRRRLRRADEPVAASMLNALMVRAMDYNDIYWKQDPSHPSDLASRPARHRRVEAR
jgi:2-methylcitrate dehydratase